jgi:hypothetical protein
MTPQAAMGLRDNGPMTEAYQPLHHKYRPKRLDELVGQEAIAATLGNALRSGRIAPAYLFSGPRGTGKTKDPPPNPAAAASSAVPLPPARPSTSLRSMRLPTPGSTTSGS